MQNPAHASRLSSRDRTVPHHVRRSLFGSREHNRAPERFSPAASKHDVDSNRACVLRRENPPMRPWHAGLTALESVTPASQNYLLLDLSTVLTVRSCELWLLTIGAVFGEANERGHPVVERNRY